MSYKYDVFISYRRTSTIGCWVRNHFVPLLQARINENAGSAIDIFCDFRLEEGANWKAALKNELVASKLLLPIWSADYFRSKWCMTEWQSFREREKLLGLWGPDHPLGLVYPVKYADGDYYHDEAKATQCTSDFSELSYPDDTFRQVPKWLDFDDLVRKIAIDIAGRLNHVPVWREFPISEPQVCPEIVMRRPRL